MSILQEPEEFGYFGIVLPTILGCFLLQSSGLRKPHSTQSPLASVAPVEKRQEVDRLGVVSSVWKPGRLL